MSTDQECTLAVALRHIAREERLAIPSNGIGVGETVGGLPGLFNLSHIGLEDFRVPEVVVILVKLEGVHHGQVLLAVGRPVGVGGRVGADFLNVTKFT